MTIKRMIFRVWVRTLEFITLKSKPVVMHNLSLKPVDAEKHVDIITVAFNNLELIEYQTLFLKKNIKDNYSHITPVPDDSFPGGSTRATPDCPRVGRIEL